MISAAQSTGPGRVDLRQLAAIVRAEATSPAERARAVGAIQATIEAAYRTARGPLGARPRAVDVAEALGISRAYLFKLDTLIRTTPVDPYAADAALQTRVMQTTVQLAEQDLRELRRTVGGMPDQLRAIARDVPATTLEGANTRDHLKLLAVNLERTARAAENHLGWEGVGDVSPRSSGDTSAEDLALQQLAVLVANCHGALAAKYARAYRRRARTARDKRAELADVLRAVNHTVFQEHKAVARIAGGMWRTDVRREQLEQVAGRLEKIAHQAFGFVGHKGDRKGRVVEVTRFPARSCEVPDAPPPSAAFRRPGKTTHHRKGGK